jgi:hypothetical protein
MTNSHNQNIPKSTAYSELLESFRELDSFLAKGIKQSSQISDSYSYNQGLECRKSLDEFAKVAITCLLECEHLGNFLNTNKSVVSISFKIRKQPQSLFEANQSFANVYYFIDWISENLCSLGLEHSDYVMLCYCTEFLKKFRDYSNLFVDV